MRKLRTARVWHQSMDGDGESGGESSGEKDGKSEGHKFGFECPACEDQFPAALLMPSLLMPSSSASVVAPASSAPLVPPSSSAPLVPPSSLVPAPTGASQRAALVPATSTALKPAYEVPKEGSQKARMVVHQHQLSMTCLAAFTFGCAALRGAPRRAGRRVEAGSGPVGGQDLEQV